MGQTAIVSPQIIDSTATGRGLITSVDAAAGRTVLEIEDASYDWTGDHVFEGSIEATTYNFTAGQDGQLNHPDLGNSLYVRFNNADVYRFNAIDFWPVANGTKNLGRSDHEWANVYSVDGTFSGTVAANTITSTGGNLTLQRNSADAIIVGGTFIQCYHQIRPASNNLYSSGTSSLRWANTYSVDGSYSGNLNVESGGSQRLYNLGTEGDTDTEYLDISASNRYSLQAKATGAGADRQLRLVSANGSGILTMGTVGNLTLSYIGSTLIEAFSTFVKFGGDISPLVDGANACGTDALRWSSVASVDGDFSGDVIMAANVDFTGLPTADPVVAGRLWNDSGTLKISAG